MQSQQQPQQHLAQQQQQQQQYYASNDGTELVHEIQLGGGEGDNGEFVATDDIELDSEGEELLGDDEDIYDADPYLYAQHMAQQQAQMQGGAPAGAGAAQPHPANGSGGLQLDEATHAAVQALGGFHPPAQQGHIIEIPDETGQLMQFAPDHPEYQAAIQHHNQQVNLSNQSILAQAQQQTQQAAMEPSVSVEDGELFAQKYMQDLGQEVESFTVYQWRIQNYRKQDKRISSPEFECGGHKWWVKRV